MACSSSTRASTCQLTTSTAQYHVQLLFGDKYLVGDSHGKNYDCNRLCMVQ